MRTVTQAAAQPHLLGRQIDLSWQNPPASDFAGGPALARIHIVRRERTFPETPSDGDLVYDGPVVDRYTDSGLKPLTTYYYGIFAVDAAMPIPNAYIGNASRVAAMATDDYGLVERFYRLLPAVHQRYDTPLDDADLLQLDPSIRNAIAGLSPSLQARGQLRRFFEAGFAPFNLARSFADGLRQIRDIGNARPEFLPGTAAWLDWQLDGTLPVFRQRNEIRFAPRFYRAVGTAPSLRALVNRYTGWYAQIAEFGQSIARSNDPPQLNVFSVIETDSGWIGSDDAAPVLGFGAGNNQASGSGLAPAELVGTTAGPFALRPGMELAVTADARVLVVVRFDTGDFADIGAAAAAEVAAALNRILSQITATVAAGRIVLSSNTVGPASALSVEQYAASLVTIEAAPRGRLSALLDHTPATDTRVRLFYAAADPTEPAAAAIALRTLVGSPPPTGALPVAAPDTAAPQAATPVPLPSIPNGRTRFKTFRGGRWGSALPLPTATGAAQADPAAVELPAGPEGSPRIWLAWLEQPNTAAATIWYAIGTPRAPQPARLAGQRTEPFQIPPGASMILRDHHEGDVGFLFVPGDFVDPQNATAVEVAAALNARLDTARVQGGANADGTVQFRTATAGGETRLEINLAESGAATALGFNAGNNIASGDWGDEVDWQQPQPVTSAPPGRHMETVAVVDATGAVWLFWVTADGATWSIASSRWTELPAPTWSALETRAGGPGGCREPCAVMDTSDRIWLAWSQRRMTALDDVGLDMRTLNASVHDPVAGTWSPPFPLTTAPATGRAADREPAILPSPAGELRLFFRSDRGGGPDLWTFTITPADPPSASALGPLSTVMAGPAADGWPAPLPFPDGVPRLMFRSDRSVPLSRLATRPEPVYDNRKTSPPPIVPAFDSGPARSVRVSDMGTLRRFAGTPAPVLADTARNGRGGKWDDLLPYTPQKPLGWQAPGQPLADDDRYTLGTVGLYLSQLIADSPVSRQMEERLKAVLQRFIPINVRVLVIFAPRVGIEFVYTPAADIGESYADNYPFVEYVGDPSDATAAAAPGLLLVRAATLDNVSNDPPSASPADPTTLRFRTYFDPLQ